MLKDKSRTIAQDKFCDADQADALFSDHVFIRLAAKGKKFTRVDFRYSVFDGCYLRNCIFDSCDFTGCRFIATNFHGSSFTGCKFEYVSFERTLIDSDILENCCPPHENQTARFARSLRMNYQQIGDAESANKAILVELDATGEHLYKAWNSKQSYYRHKYKGWHRLAFFFRWGSFKFLDFIWGNGESPAKLARSVLLALLFMAMVDTLVYRDARLAISYGNALLDSPQFFLGTKIPGYPGLIVAMITLGRLVVLGLFMSILIKRFNRR